MASCCRRYRARRLKAFGHDPQLLVIRPAPPATSFDHLKPFKLSTALLAVHKDCYAPIGLIQQGGPRRRETGQAGCSRFSSSCDHVILVIKRVSAQQTSALETRTALFHVFAPHQKKRVIGSGNWPLTPVNFASRKKGPGNQLKTPTR